MHTLNPTVPWASTKVAVKNLASFSRISGSDTDRPINRFKEPTVLRKFEISWVLAASPIARCFGPNETSDLQGPDDVTYVQQNNTRVLTVSLDWIPHS